MQLHGEVESYLQKQMHIYNYENIYTSSSMELLNFNTKEETSRTVMKIWFFGVKITIHH